MPLNCDRKCFGNIQTTRGICLRGISRGNDPVTSFQTQCGNSVFIYPVVVELDLIGL